MGVSENELLEKYTSREYEHGWVTNVEEEFAPKGLNEDIIRFISDKKGEPEWMLEKRLKAFRYWLNDEMPKWQNVAFPPIDFQDIYYYASPSKSDEKKPESIDEVDPELLKTYEKLGIPLEEQKALTGVAVDAVMDSESVYTTFKETLAEAGVIFCSISEAVQNYPELVQ